MMKPDPKLSMSQAQTLHLAKQDRELGFKTIYSLFLR